MPLAQTVILWLKLDVQHFLVDHETTTALHNVDGIRLIPTLGHQVVDSFLNSGKHVAQLNAVLDDNLVLSFQRATFCFCLRLYARRLVVLALSVFAIVLQCEQRCGFQLAPLIGTIAETPRTTAVATARLVERSALAVRPPSCS